MMVFHYSNFPIVIKFHNYFILYHIGMLTWIHVKGNTSRKDSTWFSFLLFLLSTYKICNEWINNKKYFDGSHVKHTKHCTLKMSVFNFFLTHNIGNEIHNLASVTLCHPLCSTSQILFLKEQPSNFHVKFFCCLVFYERNFPQKNSQGCERPKALRVLEEKWKIPIDNR